MSTLLHASAVAFDTKGVLVRGPAGSGKSSLCATLIDTHGAQLVADDRLYVDETADGMCVRPHENLTGLLEIRGLGLLRLPYLASASLALVVDLDAPQAVPRLPEPVYFDRDAPQEDGVPLLTLHGHDPMTALTIKLAVEALKDGFRDDAIYPL